MTLFNQFWNFSKYDKTRLLSVYIIILIIMTIAYSNVNHEYDFVMEKNCIYEKFPYFLY